jgi:hypothetical protein
METSQTGITVLADSGTSHILLQASAAHVLQQVEYSRENGPPLAELKAANHGVLTAIGRGVLSVSGMAVMAYTFADIDLANNFLGLVPFANLGCTKVFTPRSFQIYKESDATPYPFRHTRRPRLSLAGPATSGSRVRDRWK